MMLQLIRLELYKLFSQKVIYLAAAVFAALYISQFYSGLPSTEQRAMEQVAYATYGGVLTEDKLAWVEAHHEAYEEARTAAGEQRLIMEEAFRAEHQVAMDFKSALQGKATMLLDENSSTDSGNRILVIASTGEQIVVIHQEVWQRILIFIQEVGYFFAAALVILGLAGSYSRETSAGMDQLLYSSRHGRGKGTLAKLLAGAIYCATIPLFFGGLVVSLYGVHYGLHGWDAPLTQYTKLFGQTTFTGTALHYYGLQQFFSAVGCIALGWLTMLLSAWSRNVLVPAMIAGLLFILPVIILFLGLPATPVTLVAMLLFRYMEFIQANYIEGQIPELFFLLWGSLDRGISAGRADPIIMYQLLLSLIAPAVLLYWSVPRKQVR